MAVNFYLEKRADKNGDVAIRVSITIAGSRYLSSTGFKVTPAKWDQARRLVRRGASNASGVTWNVINGALAGIVEHFTEYENNCIAEKRVPTPRELRDEYSAFIGGRRAARCTETGQFWRYYDMFIEERGRTNQWTRATYQKFEALKNHLITWKPNPTFADFTEAGFGRWLEHLRTVRRLKNSTCAKQVGFLKWFLRWAVAKGFNDNDDYRTFAPRLKMAPQQVVFLDWEELMQVFNYEVPPEGTAVELTDAQGNRYSKTIEARRGLEASRDVFCFCCFTSLRYSDANNLKRSNFAGNSFTITTVKTADTITIELNKYARAILDRYKDMPGPFALPRITNQRMNIYLKDICELCCINRPVTRTYYRGSERIEETRPKFELVGTHTGRRTFICNALMLGIPAEIVMKWTGHSDYKAMKPYIEISNAAKAKAMQLFNKLE